MKIVGLIDQVGSKAGMDLYSYSLLTNLKEKGCIVSLYSNIQIDDANIATYNYFKKSNSNILSKAISLLKGYVLSYYKAKQHHTDYIILHVFSYTVIDLFAFMLSWFFQIKTVAIIHDVEPFKSEGNSKTVKYIIFNYLSSYIVVHNNYSYNSIYNSVIHSKRKNIRIIRQGAYTETNNAVHTKNIVTLPEINSNDKFLLFFGQIKAEKGLDILLSAMPLVVNNYKLVIAGRLKEKNDIHYIKMISDRKIGNRVVYLNRYISNEEKNYLFNTADIVVLPYKKIYQSAVMLTAMSNSKIIVTSDIVPNFDIIKDGENGFLFKSENIEDLARVLNYVISLDDKTKDSIKHNIYTLACKEYSWDKIAEKYFEMLK
jgi:D-inositol-3-phosphate glycosyltransferase